MNPTQTPPRFNAPPPTQPAPFAIHQGFRCPYCGTSLSPIHKGKTTQGGWILFVVLLLFCFPLAWVALFIREDVITCAGCRMKLS